ncbi:MAG TPA: hypothetical protein VKD90_27600 [Gemmataceae bacterium]|nr:hypothetical protein [Gemmataceae bacterium]
MPEPVPAPAPRRSLAEVFAQFMHERNILWGELAGGLLIVGCSIALVLSLWRTLEELPYFTFLLCAGITAAVFGAGQYTLHHWKLTATSRGLLVIALLLTPLNLLLVADPGPRGTADWIDAVVKLAAVVAFAGLVRTAGRDLVGTDQLPGAVPRRWLLALAVVGAPASQIVPALADLGPLAYQPAWLPLLCFVIASGMAVARLSRDHRSTEAEPLGERAGTALLLFVGLGLFALFAAWGFLLTRTDDLAAALRQLAFPVVVAGVPVLSAGLLVQRRVVEPPGLRATGTGVALAGVIVMFASLVLAWPDPLALFLASAAVAVTLGWVAYRDAVAWMYLGAIPCAALAVVLGYLGVMGGWTAPANAELDRWLAGRLASAASGVALAGFALALGVVAELWARRGRAPDATAYALGGALVAAVGLLLVTVHGVEHPATAAWTHSSVALGFLGASFRWPYRVVAQAGVWLLLLASLWGLWATVPDDRARWGLVVSLEGLALAVAAIGLGRVPGQALRRLRDAARDVAAAATILAPLLGLGAIRTLHDIDHTGTLYAVAATALALAMLYRQPALTWIGSLVALVGLLHLDWFPLDLQPKHGAVLVAFVVHATTAMAAALWMTDRRFMFPLSASERGLGGEVSGRGVPPGPLPPGPPLRSGEGGEDRAEPDAPREGDAAPAGTIPDAPQPPSDSSPSPSLGASGSGSLAESVFAGPLYRSAQLTSCLAVPLLLVPAPGLAPAWAVLAAWVGVIWLAMAVAWRERGGFPAFQMAITWAAGLVGFAWVERQEWFSIASLRTLDLRIIQACGIAIGVLSVGWVVARRGLRGVADARTLWTTLRPSVDQVVLGGLVVGQLVLAAVGILPGVFAELTPAGADPVATADLPPGWLAAGWLWLAVLAVTVVLHLRWPADVSSRGDAPVVGLTLLGLTVPLLAAAVFAPELAAGSALRWGFAIAFVVGSAALVARELLGGLGLRLGFRIEVTPAGVASVRGLVALAAGVVIILTIPVAWLGLAGQSPSGPGPQTVFRQMGWSASTMIPLALVVIGLAATAVRERSAGYAFAAGQVLTATVAGGYALWLVSSGRALEPPQLVWIGLFAIGSAAAWSLLWLAAERRVPGRGLLTVQVLLALAKLAAMSAIFLPPVVVGTVGSEARIEAQFAFGFGGWVMLVLAAGAGYWHAWRTAPEYRFHVLGFAAVVAGILLANLGGHAGVWRPIHTLAAAWAAGGCLLATFLFWPPVATRGISLARRLWPEVLAVGLTALGLRNGWTDLLAPLAPAAMVVVAAVLFGAVAVRTRSWWREYLSGFLLALAGFFLWVKWGPDTGSSLALTAAIGLAVAGAAWSRIDLLLRRRELSGEEPARALTPFPHFAAAMALALVLFGLIPTLSGATVDHPGLTWGAVAATALLLGWLLYDRTARFADVGLYTLGVAAVGLAVAGFRTGPVWLDWPTPLALAGYALAVSAVAYGWRVGLRIPGLGFLGSEPRQDRSPAATEEVRSWLIVAQGAVGVLVLGMAVRVAVHAWDFDFRLMGPVSVLLLMFASGLLLRASPPAWASILRPVTLVLAVAPGALLAWAIPDPRGDYPWLHRHAWLLVALTGYVAWYLNTQLRPAGIDDTWAADMRRVGGLLGALALFVLVVVLVQQIPVFDIGTRTTPLSNLAIVGILFGIVGLIALALQLALRPDRDPLGPTPHGRAGYVYLAEVLLVLLFAHVRLNVPQVFTGQAVKYWTFIVMFLAFVGVGLAELFARRGVRVLARPLMRTGVLLPLIPLLAFWAKPPALIFEFAEARAPGLVPMMGYLRNLPQHFNTYALLWFLAGLLYGLIALSRRSFGWALLGALATNAGLWALLTHHQVPAAVHPQAWAIPLALIVLVSEHVNRDRLRADVAAGMRYLGISMIYVASAADLFIAGIGQSVWLPVILAVLCVAGVMAGVMLRVRAFLYLGIGFLMLDVFAMIWHAAVDRAQTWVWYASGIILGALILALFAVLEKRRNDVMAVVARLRQWD